MGVDEVGDQMNQNDQYKNRSNDSEKISMTPFKAEMEHCCAVYEATHGEDLLYYRSGLSLNQSRVRKYLPGHVGIELDLFLGSFVINRARKFGHMCESDDKPLEFV